MCVRSGAGCPDALVVAHEAKVTSLGGIPGWLTVTRPNLRHESGLVPHCRLGPPHEGTKSARPKPGRANWNGERANLNGVISDTPCAYANGRKHDRDSHLMLAELAIRVNNAVPPCSNRRLSSSTAARTLASRSRRTLAPRPRRPQRRRAAHFARRMRAIGVTARELIAAAQAERKAKLGARRVDRVLGRANGCCCRGPGSCSLDAADSGADKAVPPCPPARTPTPAPSRRVARRVAERRSPTVDVDLLKHLLARAGTAQAPGPVSDAGKEGEHKAGLLRNGRVVRAAKRGHTP